MTEETAKTASELLKLKSQLTDDLSKILDTPKEDWREGYYCLSLCYGYTGRFMWELGGNPSLNISSNEKIKEKVKNLLVLEINKEIDKIDNKLKELSC